MDFDDFRRELDGSIEFDVLAQSAEQAAYVAMWLRETFRDAIVPSEPDPRGSVDPQRPHRLHCGAWLPDRTPEQTHEQLRMALGGFAVTRGNGDARARVVFSEAPARAPVA